MAKLIVMCGLQCSGKSTKAKELANEHNATVLSSDKIREEYPTANNETVFRLLYEQMNKLLKSGVNVIVDATNTTIKARKQIFQNLRVKCNKICHIMNTPYEVCIERLAKRNSSDYSHKFGEDVIKRYYYAFEIPFYEEGWDIIEVENKPTIKECADFCSNVIGLAKGFNQDNKHHTQLLNEHMNTVALLLIEQGADKNLGFAAYYHDIGKLFTQTYKESDPNAHYYNHANVGAYKMLCNAGCYFIASDRTKDERFEAYDTLSSLEWLFYINYHMHLFNVKTEKAEKKWRTIFGDKKYNNLVLFNEADKKRL